MAFLGKKIVQKTRVSMIKSPTLCWFGGGGVCAQFILGGAGSCLFVVGCFGFAFFFFFSFFAFKNDFHCFHSHS